MTDPVDARLLGVVAEMGRAAVHEVAARVGMDPREVASRLVALSATGLPLLVGVECDPARLRQAVAMASSPPYGVQQPYAQQPPPSGPVPTPGPNPAPPAGPYVPPGPPSGPYQMPPMQQMPRTGPPSQPFPAQTGPPSQPFAAPMPQQAVAPQPPVQQQTQSPPPPPIDPPASTWGLPGSSSWARGDVPPQDVTQPTVRPDRPEGPEVRQGRVGTALQAEGLEGERLSITLVEVVDPADYLFTAAGYRLQDGERSVVVHTELTNRGSVAFQSLPDLYLVLVTPDGKTISKAPVSLSSRPPHRIGVPPGETAGGHTVYVVPENTEISSVRWSPRPDEESRTLTWLVDD